MKLIRFGEAGHEKPGLLVDGKRLDFSQRHVDWNHDFFQKGGLDGLKLDVSLPEVSKEVRWAAPVARPGKVVCIGLNYKDHAEEAGMAIPDEPIVFMKATNTICGPHDDILIPRKSSKTDWEVELAIIIKSEARYLVDEKAAQKCIAGFCIGNDVSEREFQLERGGQWTKGKSCDNFSPIGPFLATPDEISDVTALAMSLSVNGDIKQSSSTKQMVFAPNNIVYYLSQFMTLEAGDIIFTGTPPGVGMGLKPPQFLSDGDVVELAIDGLGQQRSVCRDA